MNIDLFKNPTNEYRGKPFWSWNGKLDKDELLRQIDVLETMGMGGYFMHSRTGLATKYLGEEWFDLINACADYGYKKGMQSYLYDEDRWPSGTAGGMVTKNPAYHAKFLEKTDDGYKIVPMETDSFYNGYTYIDTLKREATEEFIRLTHEKYKEHCGDRIGREIIGIFTDEPNRGALFSKFNQGDENKIPYTDKLYEEFYKKYQYKLEEHLDELFDKKEICRVKHDYCELLQEMFIENFLKPIYEWCSDNNMLLTGHLLHENSFSTQTVMLGSIMRPYEYMHIPGVDILCEDTTDYWVAVQCRSVARQTGRKWVLSELYGCTGWQMDFQSHKHVGDWQALFGVNLRCHHLSWYTMGGEAKRDFPGSIFHQSGWYKDYKYVEDYFSRLNVVLSSGNPECELLYINPVESVWSKVYSGAFTDLSSNDDEIKKIENIYADNFMLLAKNSIDFDYGDEEILQRLASISGNCLNVGKMSYKRVLVSGMLNIRSSTYKLLKDFSENGGIVIVAGEKPAYLDQKPFVFDIKAVYIKREEIPEYAKSGKEIITDSDKIFSQTRVDGDERYIVLLNTDRENGFNATINLGRGKSLERLNARDGSMQNINFSTDDDNIIIDTTFAKGEEQIYRVKMTDNKVHPQKDNILPKLILPSEAPYTLNEPNILVLDKVLYKGEEYEVLKADRKIRDEFNLPYRSGSMLQPWFVGDNAEIVGDIEISYPFSIAKMPENDILLVLEHYKDFEVSINGNRLYLDNPCGKWIDICFDKFSLPHDMLHIGENYITLKTKFHQTNDLEAIYLLGNFGVNENFEIDILPKTLKRGDISTQGLPFYSGSITYHFDTIVKEDSLIELSYNGALAKVNGITAAFAPYTTIIRPTDRIDVEVVLTRRNTFGPLHQATKNVHSYAPSNFVTEGNEFTMDYVLIEQGLR